MKAFSILIALLFTFIGTNTCAAQSFIAGDETADYNCGNYGLSGTAVDSVVDFQLTGAPMTDSYDLTVEYDATFLSATAVNDLAGATTFTSTIDNLTGTITVSATFVPPVDFVVPTDIFDIEYESVPTALDGTGQEVIALELSGQMVDGSGAGVTVSDGSVILNSTAFTYVRGDVDGDGDVSIGDVRVLGVYIQNPTTDLPCWEAADVDGDGRYSWNGFLADWIYLVAFILEFTGPPPPAPYPDCDCGDENNLPCEEDPICL